MSQSNEQKLVDITFQMVATMHLCAAAFEHMRLEDKMEWVAGQLRGSGFDTEPCGASWGVLVPPKKE